MFLPAILMAQNPAPAPQAAPPKPAVAQPATPPPPPPPRPMAMRPPAPVPQAPLSPEDEKKVIYALGLSISRSLGQFHLSAEELDIVKTAMSDAAADKPAIDLTEWGPKISGFVQSRATRAAQEQKDAAKPYVEKAAAAPGAVKTPSGLVYREITAGTGEFPKPTDKVQVHYKGTLVDGKEFDSSYKRNAPAELPLNGVIPCWTEGLQRMKPGGKAVLVCPSSIAYGDPGRPPTIPGGATLTFEIELLSILPPTPPPAPVKVPVPAPSTMK